MDLNSTRADYRQKLFGLMAENGIFNHAQANFLSSVVQETAKSDLDELKSFDDLPDDKANLLASQVVVNYLERFGLNYSISASSAESFSFVQRKLNNEMVSNELNIATKRNLLTELCAVHLANDLPPTADSEEISTIISEITKTNDEDDETLKTTISSAGDFEVVRNNSSEEMQDNTKARDLPKPPVEEKRKRRRVKKEPKIIREYVTEYEESTNEEPHQYADAGHTYRSSINKNRPFGTFSESTMESHESSIEDKEEQIESEGSAVVEEVVENARDEQEQEQDENSTDSAGQRITIEYHSLSPEVKDEEQEKSPLAVEHQEQDLSLVTVSSSSSSSPETESPATPPDSPAYQYSHLDSSPSPSREINSTNASFTSPLVTKSSGSSTKTDEGSASAEYKRPNSIETSYTYETVSVEAEPLYTYTYSSGSSSENNQQNKSQHHPSTAPSSSPGATSDSMKGFVQVASSEIDETLLKATELEARGVVALSRDLNITNDESITQQSRLDNPPTYLRYNSPTKSVNANSPNSSDSKDSSSFGNISNPGSLKSLDEEEIIELKSTKSASPTRLRPPKLITESIDESLHTMSDSDGQEKPTYENGSYSPGEDYPDSIDNSQTISASPLPSPSKSPRKRLPPVQMGSSDLTNSSLKSSSTFSPSKESPRYRNEAHKSNKEYQGKEISLVSFDESNYTYTYESAHEYTYVTADSDFNSIDSDRLQTPPFAKLPNSSSESTGPHDLVMQQMSKANEEYQIKNSTGSKPTTHSTTKIPTRLPPEAKLMTSDILQSISEDSSMTYYTQTLENENFNALPERYKTDSTKSASYNSDEIVSNSSPVANSQQNIIRQVDQKQLPKYAQSPKQTANPMISSRNIDDTNKNKKLEPDLLQSMSMITDMTTTSSFYTYESQGEPDPRLPARLSNTRSTISEQNPQSTEYSSSYEESIGKEQAQSPNEKKQFKPIKYITDNLVPFDMSSIVTNSITTTTEDTADTNDRNEYPSRYTQNPALTSEYTYASSTYDNVKGISQKPLQRPPSFLEDEINSIDNSFASSSAKDSPSRIRAYKPKPKYHAPHLDQGFNQQFDLSSAYSTISEPEPTEEVRKIMPNSPPLIKKSNKTNTIYNNSMALDKIINEELSIYHPTDSYTYTTVSTENQQSSEIDAPVIVNVNAVKTTQQTRQPAIQQNRLISSPKSPTRLDKNVKGMDSSAIETFDSESTASSDESSDDFDKVIPARFSKGAAVDNSPPSRFARSTLSHSSSSSDSDIEDDIEPPPLKKYPQAFVNDSHNSPLKQAPKLKSYHVDDISLINTQYTDQMSTYASSTSDKPAPNRKSIIAAIGNVATKTIDTRSSSASYYSTSDTFDVPQKPIKQSDRLPIYQAKPVPISPKPEQKKPVVQQRNITANVPMELLSTLSENPSTTTATTYESTEIPEQTKQTSPLKMIPNRFAKDTEDIESHEYSSSESEPIIPSPTKPSAIKRFISNAKSDSDYDYESSDSQPSPPPKKALQNQPLPRPSQVANQKNSLPIKPFTQNTASLVKKEQTPIQVVQQDSTTASYSYFDSIDVVPNEVNKKPDTKFETKQKLPVFNPQFNQSNVKPAKQVKQSQSPTKPRQFENVVALDSVSTDFYTYETESSQDNSPNKQQSTLFAQTQENKDNSTLSIDSINSSDSTYADSVTPLPKETKSKFSLPQQQQTLPPFQQKQFMEQTSQQRQQLPLQQQQNNYKPAQRPVEPDSFSSEFQDGSYYSEESSSSQGNPALKVIPQKQPQMMIGKQSAPQQAKPFAQKQKQLDDQVALDSVNTDLYTYETVPSTTTQENSPVKQRGAQFVNNQNYKFDSTLSIDSSNSSEQALTESTAPQQKDKKADYQNTSKPTQQQIDVKKENYAPISKPTAKQNQVLDYDYYSDESSFVPEIPPPRQQQQKLPPPPPSVMAGINPAKQQEKTKKQQTQKQGKTNQGTALLMSDAIETNSSTGYNLSQTSESNEITKTTKFVAQNTFVKPIDQSLDSLDSESLMNVKQPILQKPTQNIQQQHNKLPPMQQTNSTEYTYMSSEIDATPKNDKQQPLRQMPSNNVQSKPKVNEQNIINMPKKQPLIDSDALQTTQSTTTTSIPSTLLNAFRAQPAKESSESYEYSTDSLSSVSSLPKKNEPLPEPKPVRVALKISDSESSYVIHKIPENQQQNKANSKPVEFQPLQPQKATAKMEPIKKAFDKPKLPYQTPTIHFASSNDFDMDSTMTDTQFSDAPLPIPKQSQFQEPKNTTITTESRKPRPNALLNAINGGKYINDSDQNQFSTIETESADNSSSINSEPPNLRIVLPAPDNYVNTSKNTNLHQFNAASKPGEFDSGSNQKRTRRKVPEPKPKTRTRRPQDLPKPPHFDLQQDESSEPSRQANRRRRSQRNMRNGLDEDAIDTNTSTSSDFGARPYFEPSNMFKARNAQHPYSGSEIDSL